MAVGSGYRRLERVIGRGAIGDRGEEDEDDDDRKEWKEGGIKENKGESEEEERKKKEGSEEEGRRKEGSRKYLCQHQRRASQVRWPASGLPPGTSL